VHAAARSQLPVADVKVTRTRGGGQEFAVIGATTFLQMRMEPIAIKFGNYDDGPGNFEGRRYSSVCMPKSAFVD